MVFRGMDGGGGGYKTIEVFVIVDLSNAFALASDSVVAKQTANNFQDKTLWIVVAVVAALTLVAIIIISVILCKKRTGEDLHPR